MVNTDQTIRFGSVRYSTPPGLVGAEVWVRVQGDELVVAADLGGAAAAPGLGRGRAAGPGRGRPAPPVDPGEPAGSTWRHYPDHPQQPDGTPRPPRIKAATSEEAAFLAIGDGARAWLTEAAAAGASRVRAKMAEAVELAALAGTAAVDAALGTAALAGRFGDGDLLSIAGYQAAGPRTGRRPSLTRRTPPSPAPRPGPGSAPRRPPGRRRAVNRPRTSAAGLDRGSCSPTSTSSCARPAGPPPCWKLLPGPRAAASPRIRRQPAHRLRQLHLVLAAAACRSRAARPRAPDTSRSWPGPPGRARPPAPIIVLRCFSFHFSSDQK